MTGEASRIEWLLKWQLLEKLRRKITTTSAPGVANGWNDPRLKVIDLKWAALDPADSIFTKLEPRAERVVSAARHRTRHHRTAGRHPRLAQGKTRGAIRR